MKTIALFLLLIPFVGFGQIADSVKYCEVVTVSKAITGRANTVFDVNYFFDFGNGEQYNPDEPPKGKDGKEIIFKGPADMMTWVSSKGYTLISSFGIVIGVGQVSGQRWLTHYTFRKDTR